MEFGRGNFPPLDETLGVKYPLYTIIGSIFAPRHNQIDIIHIKCPLPFVKIGL